MLNYTDSNLRRKSEKSYESWAVSAHGLHRHKKKQTNGHANYTGWVLIVCASGHLRA